MRRRYISQVDEASLQTDVMRFMAIVAFCLIAILAMVRNIEAPPLEESTVEPNVEPTTEPTLEPTVKPVSKSMPVEPSVDERVIEQLEVPLPEQSVKQVVQNEPVLTRPASEDPVEVDPEEVAPVPEPSPAATVAEQASDEVEAPQPPAELPPAEADEEGLTLRFASEADFLRLVARGKVAVYAFNDARFLKLKSNFQFAEAAPPRQVYELHENTIPRHMQAALSGPDGAEEQDMKWAVGLPQRVQRQITEWVNSVEHGELLINRFEEVHHVAQR